MGKLSHQGGGALLETLACHVAQNRSAKDKGDLRTNSCSNNRVDDI